MSEIENPKELRIKYLNGNRRTKDQILTSLCLVHGYHRKSAIRVMYGELRRLQAQRPRKRRRPGVRSRYQDPGFKAALRAIWKETDYMCSKKLKRAMPVWLPAYEEVEGVFREGIRTRLLSISAASIVRVLKAIQLLIAGETCQDSLCGLLLPLIFVRNGPKLDLYGTKVQRQLLMG